jgi:hypothetical protein
MKKTVKTTKKSAELTLTDKQIKVLKAIIQNANDASGGDFAFTDEVIGMVTKGRGALTRFQAGAILSTLKEKKIIQIWAWEKTENGWVRQITINDMKVAKALIS